MLAMILSIICIIIKFIFCVVLVIFLFFAGLRLWVEPFKRICKCKTQLYGKVALVTGGNSGIGFETAKDLAIRGATVVIASRNDKKSEEAVTAIKAISGNENVEYRHLNLGNLDSVRKFANNFNKDFKCLNILVNNAGCGNIKIGKTEDGIDLAMQINYVGPFLLTYLLLDKLIISKPSRIVIVSSYLHSYATKFNPEQIANTRAKSDFIRYANTKLCDILWTKELAKRLPEHVTVNALHPGLVMTNIFNKLNPYIKYLLFVIIYILFKTAKEGAQTVIHLCVSPKLSNSTGGYYQDCQKISPARCAKDDDLANRVWDKTIELIKQ